MYGVKTRTKVATSIVAALAATVALAAGVSRVTQDTLKLGGGSATAKVIEFDIGLGAANPKISVDGSSGLISISTTGGLAPTGALVPFAGSTAPDGWMLAYGQAVSRTTYAALFQAIGTTHGVGDGSTTFNLPDMRGRTVAGDDDMGGVAASRITNAVAGFNGAALGAAGGSQSESHAHGIAHTHIWSHTYGAGSDSVFGMYARTAGDDTATTITSSNVKIINNLSLQVFSGTDTAVQYLDFNDSSVLNYTTGVLSPPTGSDGATAASESKATINTQPTLILNYIVKT